MLALDAYLSSFAGAAILLGLALLLPALIKQPNPWIRAILLVGTACLGWRYILWRITETIPPLALTLDAFVSWSFAIVEALAMVSSTSAYLILTRRIDRHGEVDRMIGWWGDAPPRVDIYIATYNEEREVIERTLAGAMALDYPAVRFFVLDDGRRSWLKDLCDQYGAGYRTRPDNAHAKAGNINYTLHRRLDEPDAPDFIAVLDADFVPHSNFVSRVLALFHDPTVGLVQTPQHFFNPDPIQHNLGIATAYPDEQRFFFDHIEPARDAWGIAVCCGTSSMVRVAGLRAIGGLPTESVTEDFLLTLRLSENGWRTVYLNEPLTEGLAPEGLQEYIVQRGRWCLGMMEIVRKVYNPLGTHGLSLMQRLSVLDSFLFWTTTFPFRLLSLVGPLLYWYLGIIVVDAPLADVISYYLPYYIASLVALNWISGGLLIPILNDISQLLAAWPIMRAVALGLFTKGPHKFRVTAKGGDRTRTVMQWPIARPFALLFGLTVLGLTLPVFVDAGFTHTATAGDGIRIVLFWSVYNLTVLAVAMLACIERPRANRPLRSPIELALLSVNGREFRSWVLDLGVDQARVRGPYGLAGGEKGTIELGGVGNVAAAVSGIFADGYRLDLKPTEEQRAQLLRKIHAAHTAPGTTRGDLGIMIRGWMRSLNSQ